MPERMIESFIMSAFLPLAYVRHRLTWHRGPAVSSVNDRVESTFILSNVMLSLALPPLPVLPPQEAVNSAAANKMDGVEKSFFFIIRTCVVNVN